MQIAKATGDTNDISYVNFTTRRGLRGFLVTVHNPFPPPAVHPTHFDGATQTRIQNAPAQMPVQYGSPNRELRNLEVDAYDNRHGRQPERIRRCGQAARSTANFRASQLHYDAPWAHLKVMTSDSIAAYIGSANVTGAGLAGQSLELGVLVRGQTVVVIEEILDLFRHR